MGLLDNALNLQDGKRSARLTQVSRAAKINANKIKEGTYRGISLIDGTALIQLDGQDTVTSGYRLITNAPLGDGDRVSIRPNGIGLTRADAKNIAIQREGIEIIREKIPPVSGILTFLRIITISGGTVTLTGGLMEYQYRKRDLFFLRKSIFNLDANTTIPPLSDPSITSFAVSFEGANNTIVFNGSAAALTTVCEFRVEFPQVDFEDVFNGIVGNYSGANFFTCPIEVEAIINGLPSQFSVIDIDYDGVGIYSIDFDGQLIGVATSIIAFSFRFRKRGEPDWFTLVSP